MDEAENKHDCKGSHINTYPGDRVCLYKQTVLFENQYYARYEADAELHLTVFNSPKWDAGTEWRPERLERSKLQEMVSQACGFSAWGVTSSSSST